MSRYDYRIRKKLFRRKGHGQQPDFGAFHKQYESRRKAQRISRFVLILIALVFLVGIAIFTARAEHTSDTKVIRQYEKKYESTREPL